MTGAGSASSRTGGTPVRSHPCDYSALDEATLRTRARWPRREEHDWRRAVTGSGRCTDRWARCRLGVGGGSGQGARENRLVYLRNSQLCHSRFLDNPYTRGGEGRGLHFMPGHRQREKRPRDSRKDSLTPLQRHWRRKPGAGR
jgi:hypothetical protein